jgi:predicted transport protein
VDNIEVRLDGLTFNNEDYTNIQNLSGIIESSGEIGSFELGNLEISIKSLETQDMIKC